MPYVDCLSNTEADNTSSGFSLSRFRIQHGNNNIDLITKYGQSSTNITAIHAPTSSTVSSVLSNMVATDSTSKKLAFTITSGTVLSNMQFEFGPISNIVKNKPGLFLVCGVIFKYH
jgi:hypothetical protein